MPSSGTILEVEDSDKRWGIGFVPLISNEVLERENQWDCGLGLIISRMDVRNADDIFDAFFLLFFPFHWWIKKNS